MKLILLILGTLIASPSSFAQDGGCLSSTSTAIGSNGQTRVFVGSTCPSNSPQTKYVTVSIGSGMNQSITLSTTNSGQDAKDYNSRNDRQIISADIDACIGKIYDGQSASEAQLSIFYMSGNDLASIPNETTSDQKVLDLTEAQDDAIDACLTTQ
jgi:beta-xylosidase